MDLFSQAVNIKKCILLTAFARGNYCQMGQLLIIYFGFVRYLKKNKGTTMMQCMDFKEAHDSLRWEVLYNILIEFGIPMKW
jgi:hypothetical protein